MKIIVYIICVAVILLGGSAVFSDDRLPVYYFQIENQERYVYPADLETLNWREIRKHRELYRTAREDIKRLCIRSLKSKKAQAVNSDQKSASGFFRFSPEAFLDKAAVFVRDPSGDIHPLSVLSDAAPYVTVPDSGELNGRYLLGAHLILGEKDMDGDGMKESVAVSAKYLTYHRKNGGKVGSVSVVFFDDPGQMPLEIGPVINTAKSRYGGGTQTAHRDYEMMVKYMGKPLADAAVTVMSVESGWRKSFVTDQDGIFDIMPTDDRSVSKNFQNYLYTAVHHDREKNQYHIATFPVTIYKNRPEWRTKAMGFTYWAITGTAMTLLTVFGFVIRKRRQRSRELVVFENRSIKGASKESLP